MDMKEFNQEKYSLVEQQLFDVMEIIDPDLVKSKLIQVEKEFKND